MTRGERESDQASVWAAVDAYALENSVAPVTSALEDVQDAASEDVGRIVAGAAPVDGQRGVIAHAGGRFTLDLFDKPETLRAHWDALVAGYAMDGLYAAGRDVTVDDAKAFVERVLEAEASVVEAVGEGMELHLVSDRISGVALEWEGAIVHLAAFETAG